MLRPLVVPLVFLAAVITAIGSAQAAVSASPLASDADMPCLNKKSISSQDIQNPKSVTLSDIKTVPGLYDKLTTFFKTQELSEGISFKHKLSGTRIDPSQCWSLFEPNINVATCDKTKPAGESRLRIHKDIFEIYVDSDKEDVKIPLPLWSICTDGKEVLRFKFLYHRTFGPITAGPWEYTVEVQTKGKETTSVTKVREVLTGRTTPMNVGKIGVLESSVEFSEKAGTDKKTPLVPRGRATARSTTASQ